MRNFEVLNGGKHVALTDKQVASLFGLTKLQKHSVKLLMKKPNKGDRRVNKPFVREIVPPWWMFWRKTRYLIEMKELFYIVLMLDGLIIKYVAVDSAGHLQVSSVGEKINVHLFRLSPPGFEPFQIKYMIRNERLDIMEPDIVTRLDHYCVETNQKWKMVHESSTYRSRN